MQTQKAGAVFASPAPNAAIAQLVEHFIRNEKVVGSSPTRGSQKSIAGSDARVAEEARLESVYTPKGYPEFESRSLRKIGLTPNLDRPR